MYCDGGNEPWPEKGRAGKGWKRWKR
jgi:hypothetical protein